ncbi:MAG: hypothetical protein IBJ14_00770 [Hydrogenophaga sp.]|nr:hypothetical protein [Hydrogenophaga sp.]
MGAVGRAGRAVLRERLGGVGAPPVTVLCTRPFAHVPQGLRQAVVQGNDWRDCLPCVTAGDEVVIVVDAQRHAREAVFWQPPRTGLMPLLDALHAAGVRQLEWVAGPGHAPLPAEIATLQRLGFAWRDATAPPPQAPQHTPRSALERLAAWMLHTLLTTMEALGARRR